MRVLKVLAAIVAGFVLLLGLLWLSGSRSPIDEVALAEEELGIDLESQRVDVGAISLHVVFAGPKDGAPAVLLHGFPELWYIWRHQMAALARAGFRVAAPDLRGYNRSDKPSGAENYTQADYAADVVGLLDAMGWEKVHLAAHDVGAGVAWRLIFEQPERLHRAMVFNVGHPNAWASARPEDDAQTISWFRQAFQLPVLPELLFRSFDWWLPSYYLRNTAVRPIFDGQDMEVLKSAWARENAIATMINSYRAPWPGAPKGLTEDGAPAMPVRLLYGNHDAFIPRASAELTQRYLAHGAVEYWDASHWMLNEQPAATSQRIIEFFSGG